MILQGSIDNRNQLWVPITVAGDHGQQTISALLDTGFTGELLLPLQIAVPLGLKLAGVAPYQLADGSISQQMLFSASVSWGTQTRPVTVSVLDVEDALIGGGLLHGYVLLVDFQQKQLIIKEPGTDDPQIVDSVNPA
jgi:clan AA aspartic protease